jgi:glycosyltransferase involved in cell wall biosynthesis
MNSKIRIGVWLNCEPYSGGAFQYSLLILSALSEIQKKNPKKYDLVCFSPKKGWEAFIKNNLSGFTCDFVIVKRNLVHKIVGRLLRFSVAGLLLWRVLNNSFPFAYRVIYKAKVDLVICPSQDTLALEIKIPTISTIHDLMHRYESNFPEACSKKEFKGREKGLGRVCRFSKVILVDSKLGRQHVIESYGNVLNAKVIVLPFLPPPYVLKHDTNKNYSYVKDKYGLYDKYIFYPAQFWKHKNHHGLVRAIKLLQQKGESVNVIFAGSEKNNYQQILRSIEESELHSQIKILGYISNDDIVGLYKNALALVMPTFFGPTNIPIVEAFFLGVPVVCSNVYAMPEQVGEAGLLFDPNNIDDMAEKIYAVWTDEGLRKNLVRKGYERIKGVTLENYAMQWEEVIEAAYTALP